MSSTLREASKDTLQVKDKTWHYYSLPLAAKELGDLTRLPKSQSPAGESAALAGR
jgi:aconitate hydratase